MARTKLNTDTDGYVRVDRDYVVSIKASEPPQSPALEGESEEQPSQPQPQPKVTYQENPSKKLTKRRVTSGIFIALWVILILAILFDGTLLAVQFIKKVEALNFATIPGLQDFANFMQSGLGLVIFVVLPILLLIVHYVVQRHKFNKKKKQNK